MKFIEDYRGIYIDKDKPRNKEIWIIGCGASVDDYPDSFFQGKITIALNYSILIFPDLVSNPDRYAHAGDTGLPEYLKLHRPDLLKKCIFLLPLFPGYWPQWFGKYQEESVYMRFHCIYGNKERFESVAKCIMKKKQCSYIVEGTCLHSAIEAAVVLGAKKVTLVGCEAKCTKYKSHAQKRGMWFIYKENGQENSEEKQKGETPSYRRFRNGTLWLAQAFKPYGIEIMRYYYDTGYEEIT